MSNAIDRMLVACRSTRFPSQPCVEQATEELAALRSENDRLKQLNIQQANALQASGIECGRLIDSSLKLRTQLAQAREALEKIRGLSFNDNLVAAYDIATEALRSPAAETAADSEPWTKKVGECADCAKLNPNVECRPCHGFKPKKPVPKDEKDSK